MKVYYSENGFCISILIFHNSIYELVMDVSNRAKLTESERNFAIKSEGGKCFNFLTIKIFIYHLNSPLELNFFIYSFFSSYFLSINQLFECLNFWELTLNLLLLSKASTTWPWNTMSLKFAFKLVRWIIH